VSVFRRAGVALGPSLRYERRALLLLAAPAVLSCLLTNSWRFIDHYWIKGLGLEAQAAVSACFFVSVMNYALHFLAAGGALPLISQSLGAGRAERAAELCRHALVLAFAIGFAQMALGPLCVPTIVDWLGMRGATAEHALRFTRMMYWISIPLAFAPVIDFIFLARGNARVPLLLQALAAALNWILNPLLIYGADVPEPLQVPGSALGVAVAGWFDFHGLGVEGAALATGLARAASALLGLVLLSRFLSVGADKRWRPWRRLRLNTALDLLRVAAPNALSIGVYSAVYWGLQGLVIAPLGSAVRAGLGVGFQVFEGLSYPCYLGLSLATASLVGRRVGAADPEGCWRIVRAARQLGWCAGLFWTAAFLLLARWIAPHFALDPAALRETLLYTSVIALSQVCVAQEAVNERVLLGAGRTRAIFWIAGSGNLLRLPLCWWIALRLGAGAPGVYWVLNATSAAKALSYRWLVQRRHWLMQASSAAPRADPPTAPTSSPR
jgi:MATE family multidrug resistance protein